ncbi:hypothetical protein [Kineosporia babensis]|uniref:Uncharacterized protein n=1 Tax=Kineosporia babensis TaxID=499548 RepID=A0A9X1NJV5_9ACTN|nr:hypothetical protein [Kineosporia babensis]MCD5315410.1 hypothetical protein [Kineosporia babensis]
MVVFAERAAGSGTYAPPRLKCLVEWHFRRAGGASSFDGAEVLLPQAV